MWYFLDKRSWHTYGLVMSLLLGSLLSEKEWKSLGPEARRVPPDRDCLFMAVG